eukprot:1160759-Pelagomonas_calceolata.AAC.10
MEAHWLRRAASPLHHTATKQKALMGTWRVTGSTRLQNLAVRSILGFGICQKLGRDLSWTHKYKSELGLEHMQRMFTGASIWGSFDSRCGFGQTQSWSLNFPSMSPVTLRGCLDVWVCMHARRTSSSLP